MLKNENISHADMLIMVNNPYAEAIGSGNISLKEERRQIIRKEYPEMDVASIAYLGWEDKNLRLTNIKEGADDCAISFAMFTSGIKGVINTATTAWKLFFSRKITQTAVKNAQKVEKVANKLLEGEGRVGTYEELQALNKELNHKGPASHHMHANDFMKKYGVPNKEGICMNVAQSNMKIKNVPNRQAQTRTFGGKAKMKSELNPHDELAADIKDMKNIYKKMDYITAKSEMNS